MHERSEISGKRYLALDTETGLIGKGQIVPPLVCVTVAHMDLTTEIFTPWDTPDLEAKLSNWLTDPDLVIVTANGSFDASVLISKYPGLITDIFQCYEDGRFVCTQIRQKLMDLAYDGDIDSKKYSLNALQVRYLLGDRSHLKEGDDVWRLRYIELLDVPLSEWPADALSYALDDAKVTMQVALEQDNAIEREPPRQDFTLGLHSAAALTLQLVTAHGIWTDPERVAALEEALDRRLSDEALAPLVRAGILRPAEPPRPYKNGKGWTKGKDQSVDTKKLRAYFERLYKNSGMSPEDWVRTPKGEISTSAESLTLLQQLIKEEDPILECWASRQEVNKTKTTYLPHLKEGIVYASFDPLKSTGRCSSRGSRLFPSMNMQNLPRTTGELSVRECFVPRPGKILLASDYSGLELCSAGSVVKEVVGFSTLLDRINAGIDNHAYLGAQICHKWDDSFARTCDRLGARDQDSIYRAFQAMRESDPKTWDHYRTFAKPTGLGYPGGLGPETFVAYARTTYGVTVTFDEAIELRNLWHQTYPEWAEFFKWVASQGDPYNLGDLHYFSPHGMRRAATTFCQTANGKALQTPSAEGMKLAQWATTRACWDPSEGSILYGSRLVDVIHDELMVEMEDDALASDRAKEVQKIMEEVMTSCFPDVSISTEAAIMRRWYKQAKPVLDSENNLLPWEPNN